MNAVELRDVTFTYQNEEIPVLEHVNLEINEGEFILLTGRSGCGKTTLTRLINGLIPHFFEGKLTGDILISNKNINSMKSYELAQMVGSVFQDPRSQFFTTNTVTEVAFGCENLNFPPSLISARVIDAFQSFHIEELNNRSIFSLSSGEKQKIALASIYAMQPKIYVLDEPSANLDIQATQMLADLLRELKAQGNTIIISEHRLYYLMDLVDRILYIDHGKLSHEWSPKQALSLSNAELIKNGLRAFDLNHLCISRTAKRKSVSIPAFKVQDLKVRLSGKDIISDISMEISPDKNLGIIGITGKNGVGKTTLVRAICGLIKHPGGAVILDGHILSVKHRSRELYFVMQDVDYQLFTESVDDELQLGNRKIDNLEERITASLKMLDLENYRETHPMALSGGQKQRVTIAAAAINNARVLFFDEPTSGLDGESMRSVSNIIERLHEAGKLIFIISHDLEFLLNTCDRILHMEKGGVSDDFELTSATLPKLKHLLMDK